MKKPQMTQMCPDVETILSESKQDYAIGILFALDWLISD